MRDWILLHMAAWGLSIILDLFVGDPHFMPHPVRAMGRLISFLEKKLSDPGKREGMKPATQRRRGMLLWFLVIAAVGITSFGIVAGAYLVNRWLGLFAETILTCYCLAAKSLYRESMAVQRELQAADPDGARHALSMIVGRDTQVLSEEEVIKAAVETVAENTSDGVIAPLLYTAVGGPVLGLLYKAVNTMDSMLGYKNETYLHFGAFAARADDVCNYLPSRISALCMIAGAYLLGCFDKTCSGKEAGRIWKRDRRNHSSPNSAQTESVCAGALGLKLGGTHLYQGKPVEKPEIGDARREVEPADIRRANRLMFATEGIAAVLVGMLFSVILIGMFAVWNA